jgi:UDP-N-acetyl-D-glucosamine dehydrogenase
MTHLETIMQRITGNTVKVGIIGLGYVGLPLAVTFARNGVTVLGFEKSAKKAESVNAAQNYIGDVTNSNLIIVVNETKNFPPLLIFPG